MTSDPEIYRKEVAQSQDLEATRTRDVWLYNHPLPQKALGHTTPMEAMKKWYAEKLDLFIARQRNRPGPDK